MGLKEEMEGDLAAATTARSVARPSVRGKKATTESSALVHQHGNGQCDQTFLDDDGKRRVARVQGRIPKYLSYCKACIAEDKARMAAAPADIDFDSTVFLIPEDSTDAAVANAYLAQRYPGAELVALPTIRPARLALRQGVKLVVVTRRALPGANSVGSNTRLIEDKRGDMIEQNVPPSEYIPEVVESAPLDIDSAVVSTAATMLSDGSIDLLELCSQLCDLAAPRHRVEQYQRVPGSDEVVFTMRYAGG